MSGPIRQFPRYAVVLDCRIRHGGATLTGRSRDVSKNGVSCVVGEAIPVSAVIELEMALAFGNDSYSEPVRLDAIVVWCTRLGGPSAADGAAQNDNFQIGAKFVNMTPQLSKFIDLFAEYLDA